MFDLIELDQRQKPQNSNMTVGILQRNCIWCLVLRDYEECVFKRGKKDCKLCYFCSKTSEFFINEASSSQSDDKTTVLARFSVSNTISIYYLASLPLKFRAVSG